MNITRFLLLFIVFVLLFFSFCYSYKLYGNVYDPEGSRLSNIEVSALLGDIEFSKYNVNIGYYELDVPKGTFFIVAKKPGYRQYIGKIFVNQSMEFNIYLYQRSGNYLYGKVVGAIIPQSIDLYSSGKRVAKDTISDNGLFLFSGLPKGTYEVRAIIDGTLVSEKVIVDDDKFVFLQKKTVEAELSSLQELAKEIKINESKQPLLILPDIGYVNQEIHGYILNAIPGVDDVLVLETNTHKKRISDSFVLVFDRPGNYTVNYANINRKIEILKQTEVSKKIQNFNGLSSSWLSSFDLVYLFLVGLIFFVGISLIIYSYFFKRQQNSYVQNQKSSVVLFDHKTKSKKSSNDLFSAFEKAAKSNSNHNKTISSVDQLRKKGN